MQTYYFSLFLKMIELQRMKGSTIAQLINMAGFSNSADYKVVFKPGAWPAHTWFLEKLFLSVMSVCVCVSAPETINYIHVIFKLYN